MVEDVATPAATAAAVPEREPARAPHSQEGTIVPGVPLAVAGVNALTGLAGAGVSVGGPASLAVAGAVAGLAAVGVAAGRGAAKRRRTTVAAGRGSVLPHRRPNTGTPGQAAAGSTAQRSAAGQHRGRGQAAPTAGHAGAAAAGGRGREQSRYAAQRTGSAMTGTRTAPTTASASTTPSAGPARGGGGRGGVPRQSGGARSANGPQRGADRRRGEGGGAVSRWSARVLPGRRNAPATRTGAEEATRGGGRSRAGVAGGGGLFTAAPRSARSADREARRLAKGIARAERRAGLAPGSSTSPAGSARPAAQQKPGELTEEQRKQLKRSAWRHRGAMTAAGAVAGGVGLLSAVVGNWRHRGMVSRHARRTWWRLADRARAARDARDAAILGLDRQQDGQRGPVPLPAQFVNRPGRQAGSGVKAAVAAGMPGAFAALISLGKPTNQKGTTVSDSTSESTVPAFSLSSAADVMLQAATTFDPELMVEFQQLVEDLPTAFGTIQEVLRVLAEKSAESLPVDPAVVEEIGEGYRAMGKVVQALEEVAPVYMRVHEADIERVDNPRNGLEAERKWNV
ncbi:hypothetical protein [Kitasatospora viridis]|uniref:hypothetical protein n=1 Tax=Kitasatospora viridis TaxID=281105 RepID=UPI0014785249|nr:hypothetical protein [Kitasatospora viridis]